MRPVDELVLSVIGPELGGRRKDDLVLLRGMDPGICKIEKGMDKRGPVVRSEGNFEIGFSGMNSHPQHELHTVPDLQLTDPDRTASILVLLHDIVHRHKCGGPVVVRKVPFNAPGYPCTQHSDQSRLDHMLPVNEIIPVGLIQRTKQPAPYLGQQFDLMYSFSRKTMSYSFSTRVSERLSKIGIGIYPSLGTLVGPSLIEPGYPVGLIHEVGGKDDRFLPDLHRDGNRCFCPEPTDGWKALVRGQ